MENFRRILKTLSAAALLMAAGIAHADPATIVANIALSVGASAGTALTIASFVASYGAAVAGIGYLAYSSASAKRKARAAAARQRSEYNAGLADRMTTLISAEAPQRVVYGRSYVGGAVVAMFTSDRPPLVGYSVQTANTFGPGGASQALTLEGKNKDALRHLVVILTAHEVQSISRIKVDGFDLGTLSPDGYPLGGEYYRNYWGYRSKSFTAPASGVVTLDEVPESVSAVTQIYQDTSGRYSQNRTRTFEFSASGATVTVRGAEAGSIISVHYRMRVEAGTIRVQKHLGTPNEPADAYLQSVVPGSWGPNHLLRGYSYLVVTLDLNDRRFQGGPPSIQAEVDGKKVLDPRTGQTVWSTNPALCIADYLQSPMWQGNSRVSIIQSDLIAAANACDARGYACNGSFSTDDSPDGVLEDLRECMAGEVFVAGGWRILAGVWTTPVARLDIAKADGQVEVLQVGASWSAVLNSVRGNYIQAGTTAATDFPPYSNATLVAADGERLWDDVSFPFTNRAWQCADLARIRVEKSRNGFILRWPASMEDWSLQPGDRVWVNYPLLGLLDKPFRVTEWGFGAQTPVMLTLEEDSATTYDLIDQGVVDQTPNTTLPNPYAVPSMQGLQVFSGRPEDLMSLADGTIVPTIQVLWSVPANLPANSTVVFEYANSQAETSSHRMPAEQGSTRISGVSEGQFFLYRARFETAVSFGDYQDGTHTVRGKSTPPSAVQGGVVNLEDERLVLSWGAIPDLDRDEYEVRLSNFGWGEPGAVFRGRALSCTVEPAAAGTPRYWYIKAIDTSRNFSEVTHVVGYTLARPSTPTGVSYAYFDTSLTSAEVQLAWGRSSSLIGLSGYQVSYGSASVPTSSTQLTLPADWVGSRTFEIRSVDRLGNLSLPATLVAEKLAPAQVLNLRAQVIDNTVMLYWTMPPKTSLPTSHVLIKKGADWATAEVVGTKDGGFTVITELSGGAFRYWLAVVDTDGHESAPTSLLATVSQPPDFKFNGAWDSNFSGTRVNAVTDGNILVLPANAVESIQQHFDSNGWPSAAAQVAAGYPYYLQPGLTSGYYEEVFDYGAILPSTQARVELDGVALSGNPNVFVTTSFSNGGPYVDYPGATSVFATDFQFVKIRVDVSQAASGDLYSIRSLRVVLQSKQKADSGTLFSSESDVFGTLVNFNQEFVDVESINPSGTGTSPVYAVPEFLDAINQATYTRAGGQADISLAGHNLVVGQRVRLQVYTGGADTGVYTVTAVPGLNTFTVAMPGTNTAGNLTVYWAGFRVRLFDQTGARISGNISWAARGY
jgi:hypothetical protein